MASDRRTLVAALLRKARIDAGRSVDDSAAQIGVTARRLTEFETARRTISLPHLEALAPFYRVPMSYFWQEEIPETDPCAESGVPDTLQARLMLRRKLIGAQLRQGRLAAGKSMQEAGEAIGANAKRIEHYEEALREAPVCEVEALAELYGLPIQAFIMEEPRRRAAAPAVAPVAATEAAPEPPAAGPSPIDHLDPALRDFVSKPVNSLYLQAAMRMSRLKVEDLRKLGESLLEITY